MSMRQRRLAERGRHYAPTVLREYISYESISSHVTGMSGKVDDVNTAGYGGHPNDGRPTAHPWILG